MFQSITGFQWPLIRISSVVFCWFVTNFVTIDSHLKLILDSWTLNRIHHYCNFVGVELDIVKVVTMLSLWCVLISSILGVRNGFAPNVGSFVICASSKHQVENCSVFSGYITQCKNSWSISKNELTTYKSRHSIFWSALHPLIFLA